MHFHYFYYAAVKLEKVTVFSGRTAELPCDITPPTLDSLYLVLWYKNDSDFPIYKYVNLLLSKCAKKQMFFASFFRCWQLIQWLSIRKHLC